MKDAKGAADDLLRTDFHALTVIMAVHRTGSFRAAAAELDLSQSSVSYTVARLRDVFGDPLFTRLGRRVEPTERCNHIVAGAERLLRDFKALTITEQFDPLVATGRFVLSSNFYERGSFLTLLMKALAERAPNIRLSVIDANANGQKQLEAGICDVVVAPLLAAASGIYRKRLLTERYACFVASDHPLAARPMSLEDYVKANHVVVRPGYGWRPYFHDELDRLGVLIDPVLDVPSFDEIDRIIAASDLILTATEGLERIWAPKIACIPAPFACTFPVEMFWTGRTHSAPSHVWFRSLIAEIARDVSIADRYLPSRRNHPGVAEKVLRGGDP